MTKKLILVFLAITTLGCFGQKSNKTSKTISYTLSWDGKSSEVKVNIKIPTLGKKEIQLIYTPSPFDPNFNPITSFNIVGNIPFSKENNSYTLKNKDELAVLEINYTLNGINSKDGQRVGLMEAMSMHCDPNVKTEHLQLLGRHFLLQPNDNEIAELEYAISWTNIPENIKGFDLTKNKKAPFSEVYNSLYLFSKDLTVDTFTVKNVPYYILNTTKEPSKNQAIIKNTVNSIMPETMRFFNDYDFPYYYIYAKETTAIPTEDIRMYGINGLLSAEAFENGFTGTSIGELGVKESLTVIHESVHRWLSSLEGSFDHLWFNEGFTEYITLYVAASSGFVTDEEFEKLFNNQLEDYYSAFKDMPSEYRNNDFIKKNVQTDENIMAINYCKGFAFAFYLDNKIRLASKGKKTIRDLMIDYNLARKKANLPQGTNISLETFENLAGAYLPISEVKSAIKKYMIDGDYIDFSAEKLIEGIAIEAKTVQNPRNGRNDTIPNIKLLEKGKLKTVYAFQ